MQILGQGLAALNDLVDGQKDRFAHIESRQVDLRNILENIIIDLNTKLTGELVKAVEQIDSTLVLNFREQGQILIE
jgi:hypothetical protein